METVYHGIAYDKGQEVVVEIDGVFEPLDPRFDLRRHSPDGFAWGYHGSGPAQLALAVLAHATGDDELALHLYQEFKRQVIASLPQDDNFVLPKGAVTSWVSAAQIANDLQTVADDHKKSVGG